ncbi:MAG: BON domain-containing protein [Bdellovibrionales bacterium]
MFTKKTFKHLLVAFVALAVFGEVADASRKKKRKREYIHLSVGLTHDKVIPGLPRNPQYEGNWRKIMKLSVDGKTNTLRLNPTKVGNATLIIRDTSGRRLYEYFIVSKKSNLNHVVREISSLLGDVEGITIKVINNKVIVDGQILLPRDMSRIYNVCAEYKENCSSLVTLSPLAQKKLAKYIERDINNPDISVRAVNNKFILEGQARDKAEKDRAEIIAKTYVPDVVVDKAEGAGIIKKHKVQQIVINLISLKSAPPPEPGKIIQLVVHYVELKKNYNKGFRFQWTPTLGDGSAMAFSSGGNRGPSGVVGQITGTINNLLPRLNWAKEHGYARVLQSTSIIVQDGNNGQIQSMTRIPYTTATAEGNITTSFEEAGLKTSIKPKIMGNRSDTINLNINFTIKSLLNMTAAGPVISNSNINTVIMVRSGQSAAIGGLVQNSNATDYNKLPQQNANPLFSLYASKFFRRDQSQFVVFVTPVIKSSASEGADRIKRKVRLLN